MFFGIYKPSMLEIQDLTDSYFHHQDHDSECYFIGEILSDREVTYQAFQRFKQDQQSQHLLFLRGNYQVIIRIHNKIWLFSDLGNVRPIYYTQQKKRFLFASQLTSLHQHHTTPIHVPWFQRALLSSGFHLEAETPYQDIYMIPGGWGLQIQQDRSQLFQAWHVDQESNLSLDEAQQRLKEELTISVLLRCQCHQNITTDLSGGLDSSTLTWIASNRHPVTSLTIKGKEENDDFRIAKEIANTQPNIKHHVLTQNQIPSIYADMEQIRSDIPISFYWSAGKARKKFRWANEHKSDLHFSGEGGDTVLGADFTYLVDLIYRFRWKTLLSHAQGWAEQKRVSAASYLLGACRLACNLPFNPSDRHALSTHHRADWFTFATDPIPKKRFSKYRGVSDTINGIHYLGYISHGLKDLAEQEQVYLSVPYLDHNVLRVCLNVPSEEKMTPGELKPLLKRAFPALPACLLNRNTKGDYTPDVYAGMKQHFNWFQDRFTSMYLADMGLIDLDKFQVCIDRLSMGVPVPLPEFHQTLSLEMWLRQEGKK